MSEHDNLDDMLNQGGATEVRTAKHSESRSNRLSYKTWLKIGGAALGLAGAVVAGMKLQQIRSDIHNRNEQVSTLQEAQADRISTAIKHGTPQQLLGKIVLLKPGTQQRDTPAMLSEGKSVLWVHARDNLADKVPSDKLLMVTNPALFPGKDGINWLEYTLWDQAKGSSPAALEANTYDVNYGALQKQDQLISCELTGQTATSAQYAPDGVLEADGHQQAVARLVDWSDIQYNLDTGILTCDKKLN